MPLLAGSRLGVYEILAPIGAGGMGEVFRARDTKLDRQVAIKTLPDALIGDPERLARFEREAKVLAALNHPNIAQIYAVEQGALVMELVEGETLKGPLPLETTLNYAKQIAEALEAAHEKGIIHRDLKPANIMITGAGVVKVLDFGLAKAGEQSSSDPQNSPTLTMSPTQAGMILGTAAYMAPEQARGKTVDKRADIWAFGCVLYEMLTGKQLFHGENVSDILAAVLKEEPDLDRVPAKVRRLLERCLEKDPKKRLRDIGDWALLLDEAKSLKAARPLLWIAAVSALVLALAVLGLVHFREGPPMVTPNLELTLVPPPGLPLRSVGGLISPPEISPDGSAVLYFAGAQGLFVRRLDSLEPKLVPGSQASGSPPFWSADSRTVVYQRSDGTWVKVRVPDGAPETVMPSEPSRGGSWSDTGDILVGAGQSLELLPAGGKSVRLDIPALKEGYYSSPEFLPGGTDFLFRFTPQNGEGSATYLATLRQARATDPVLLFKSDTAAHYTPAGGGRLLFVRGDNLYAQRLDLNARKLIGESQLVAENVASGPGTSRRADFSVSRTGVLAWRPGKAALSQVTIFDRQGNVIGTAGPGGPVTSILLSPDEKRLVANSIMGSWLLDVGQSGSLSLGVGWWWLWAPDGTKLIGQSQLSRLRIGERAVSGTGEIRDLGDSTGLLQDLSADGTQALFGFGGGNGVTSALLRGTDAERVAKKVVDTGEEITGESFSPDGRWVAYCVRQRTVRMANIYVQPFPGPGLRRQIAAVNRPPSNLQWRRDGKEMIYAGGGDIYSVRIEVVGSELKFGAPQKLFSGLRPPPGLQTGQRPLAVSRDGSRIFWPQGVDQPDSNMIHIKTGWIK